MLIDDLEEKAILENRVGDSNQCFYLTEFIESHAKKRQKATEVIDSREDDIYFGDAYTVAKSKHLR